MSTIHAALEVGTTRTVMAIGEAMAGGRLRITHAEIPSTGVRKSQILDISHAADSIKSVLHEIERKQEAAGSNLTIGNAFLATTGQRIEVTGIVGTAPVRGPKVTDDDINEAMRSARSMAIPAEQELLDVIEQDYTLDDRGGIVDPLGMSGKILRLNTLQIRADVNRLNDIRTAAEEAKLAIRDPLFSTTCAAEAVLEEHERKNGVLVIELGGGSTGYAAYCDGHLATAGVIGVGGDHVTNDIANAFQTTNAQAETLKCSEACAMPGIADGESPRVKVPGSNPLLENRTISRKSLNAVANARLRELVEIIAERIDERNLLHRLHAGTVLVGGGARMRGIDALVRQQLGTSVRTGRPLQVDGLEDDEFPAAYAAIAGVLLYAHRNYEEKSFIGDLFRRFF